MSRLTHIHPHPRGVATLTVVAILFFVVALVAAYTNRNLIFEQRTASNHWRSTLALEAADGASEWVLALLNSGRIDDSCLPTTDTTAPSLRERYLTVAPNGALLPLADLSFGCVSDGTGSWSCSCPSSGTPSLSEPAGTGVHPAFRARFVREHASILPPGVIRLEINGCTRLDDSCLAFPARGISNEGLARVTMTLGMRNALAAPPVAAITVRGAIAVTGSTTLGAYNPDPAAGGRVVQAGADVDAGLVNLGTSPGTPADRSLMVVDHDSSSLGFADRPASRKRSDHLFGSTFAMWPQIYEEQAGALVLDCASACDGDDVRLAVSLNPGRPLWIKGDVNLDGSAPIGSAAAPVMLVVQGSPQINTDLYGVVYVRQTAASDTPEAWNAVGGNFTLTGALIVEGGLAAGSDTRFTVLRDPAVLDALRHSTGSFVRLPLSWKDN